MEFGLSARVVSSTAFLPISEKEYEEIAEAKAGLLEALFVEEKFDLVVENYLELELCFLESTTKNMVLGNQDYQWFQVQRNLFNRRLVNLLSACRSYVDYSKQHIQMMLPKDENAVERIKSAFSNHYDSCLGYRAMEALRNFVQHRGFPIHAASYNAEWNRKGEESQSIYGLSVYTKTIYLREDGEFKTSVLEELERLGGRVNIKPLIRDYVAALGDVHAGLREMTKQSVETWDRVVLETINRFKTAFPDENSMKGLAAVLREEGEFKRPISVFSDLNEYRRMLQRKNGNLAMLGKRYVSGEVLNEKHK
jgi:hypothetical protein